MTTNNKYIKFFIMIVVLSILVYISIGFLEVNKNPKVSVQLDNQFEETVTVYADKDYNPYSFIDKEGNPQGYDIELIYMLAKEMEVNIDLKMIDWSMSLEEMDLSDADIILGLDYSKSSRNVLNLSIPTQTSKYIAFGKEIFYDVNELYTKNIGILEGSIANDLFIEPNHLHRNTRTYSSYEEAFQAILNNEIDYLVGRYNVGKRVLKEGKFSGIDTVGRILTSNSFCYGVSKNQPELLNRLNDAIYQLNYSKFTLQLTQKWLGSYVRFITIKDYVEMNKMPIITISAIVIVSCISLLVKRKQELLKIEQHENLRIEQEKQLELMKLLKRHVAPNIAEYLVNQKNKQGILKNETRDVVVMFVDIRKFTNISETLKANDIIIILNEFFHHTTQSVFKYGGTVDKLMGDMIMVVFNSPVDLPEYNEKAILCALEIKSKLAKFEQDILKIYGCKVGAGIGISCGLATVGNIGTEERVDFTAVGDVVNVASRLQAITDDKQIFISEEMAKRIDDKFELKFIGLTELKGKINKVNAYELLGVKDDAVIVVDNKEL